MELQGPALYFNFSVLRHNMHRAPKFHSMQNPSSANFGMSAFPQSPDSTSRCTVHRTILRWWEEDSGKGEEAETDPVRTRTYQYLVATREKTPAFP